MNDKDIQEFLQKGKCPKCKATHNIIKSGIRYNSDTDVQIFKCRDGRHFFSIDMELLIE